MQIDEKRGEEEEGDFFTAGDVSWTHVPGGDSPAALAASAITATKAPAPNSKSGSGSCRPNSPNFHVTTCTKFTLVSTKILRVG